MKKDLAKKNAVMFHQLGPIGMHGLHVLSVAEKEQFKEQEIVRDLALATAMSIRLRVVRNDNAVSYNFTFTSQISYVAWFIIYDKIFNF